MVYRETEVYNVKLAFISLIIPPAYKVYRGYIVFAFSVTMFVCKLFFPSDISRKLLDLGF